MNMMNLNKKLNKLENKKIKKNGVGKKILLRIFVVLIILVLITIFPARGIYMGVKDMSTHGKALASAYQSQNFGQFYSEVSSMKKSMENINTSVNFLLWMGFIPIVGSYYNDVRALSSASVEALTATETILVDLKPYEKELGFLGQPIAGQDRITQAIKILEKATPNLSKVENHFKKAADLVEDINVDKYPENFRGVPLRRSIQTAKNFIVGSSAAVTSGRAALAITPDALGQYSPKTYLLLFQNDKEIRATGGFITAFAFLKLDKGQIDTTTSDDIYRLDERLLATCESKICPLSPPAPIVKYLPEVTGKARSAWSMRDSNISPDIPTSVKAFERMYLLLGQGLPFDGIIYIDSQVVEELIDVTGPVEIFGTPYSSKIDTRCNCPNVIYELESYSEIAAKGQQDRKAVLGVLMQQILAKSIGADIEKVPQFIETVVRLANHKHVLFYLHNDKNQSALAQLGWTGQIKDFDGDYLHINDSNFAGGKSNLYVEQTVTQEISKDKDGIRKKLTVEYKNPQPFNTWLNGINRDYIRIYVPKGSKLISSKGSDEKVNTFEDLGKSVFEAFIVVRPQNSRTLEFEYTVPYQPKGEYELLIQKQPGAKDFRYKIKVNSKQIEDFALDMDKQFKFSI